MNVLRLHPDHGGPAITIELDIARVGRDSSAEVHLRDASVSRQHAEIQRRGEEWVIVDRNSGNGIRIDGQRTQEAVLLPGQQLHIGNLRFRVEIDRGDDGATMMLGRSPLLDSLPDETLMTGAMIAGPAEPETRRRVWVIGALVTSVALVGLALAAVTYLADQQTKEAAPVAVMVPTPLPTPEPTATPEPTPTPTPTPRPMGTLLISTDVDSSVWIDGRVVAHLKAAELRRFNIAPGEHLVRFGADGSEAERVVRVRINEQTVVRRTGDLDAPTPESSPSPTPSATPL